MTRKRRTRAEINQIKLLLADIIQDTFDKNGQVVTHAELARRHVLRNQSIAAEEEVALYGGLAVVYLRKELNYAIVPITGAIHEWTGDTDDEVDVLNTVAGLGAGGARAGWYHPTDRDDLLWVYYIGHLGRAGVWAVFHAAQQSASNPQLLSGKGQSQVAARALKGLPKPPEKTETKILEARLRP